MSEQYVVGYEKLKKGEAANYCRVVGSVHFDSAEREKNRAELEELIEYFEKQKDKEK